MCSILPSAMNAYGPTPSHATQTSRCGIPDSTTNPVWKNSKRSPVTAIPAGVAALPQPAQFKRVQNLD
jgi:hypothetical protein